MVKHKEEILLIINDSPSDLKDLGSILGSEGYEPIVARNENQAFICATEEIPNIILLDTTMPDLDALRICKELKSQKETRDVPILFLIDDREHFNIKEGFEVGAADYLQKPFEPSEVIARVQTHLMQLELKRSMKKLNLELWRLASFDALTGLANRRYFMEQLSKEFDRYKRYGSIITVLLIDVVNLKEINDTYGHSIGDSILKKISKIGAATFRICDTMGRIDGEEFAIILPETELAGAQIVAQRITEAVAESQVATATGLVNFSVNIGIARANGNKSVTNHEELLKMAEIALNQAKKMEDSSIAVFNN